MYLMILCGITLINESTKTRPCGTIYLERITASIECMKQVRIDYALYECVQIVGVISVHFKLN